KKLLTSFESGDILNKLSETTDTTKHYTVVVRKKNWSLKIEQNKINTFK
ncbi:hypothetical protein DFH31_000001, partial [Clostridium beijerinckii]|nr:hypothetical protein [Clostridium beijerinckii]